MLHETQSIKERYSRRDAQLDAQRYHPLHPATLMAGQERERAIAGWLRRYQMAPRQLRLLEVGCGTGRNLLDLIRLGFSPENLAGNDLLSERVASAAANLPASVRLICCDAMDLDYAGETFDVVFQSTVFTSIHDREFQSALARRMWNWVAPGGGVLWYDFIYDNPNNPDVKGIPLRRVRELFPDNCGLVSRRLTLAPPLSRLVTRIHPCCYSILNLFPLLRTHILCWIPKPQKGGHFLATQG